jgi:hypothetical protein
VAACHSAAGRGWHAIQKIDGNSKVSLYGSYSASKPLLPPDNHPDFLPDDQGPLKIYAALERRIRFIISPQKVQSMFEESNLE